MRRREEKRRKLHEALIETLYPPASPPSPSSSPSPVEFDDEPFDVTLMNPEDYVNIDSPNHDNDENGDESETKPSRAKRKRIRKKMLKEEAARRRKVIGPLLPTEMVERREDRVADAVGSNGGGDEASCVQPARQNAQEKEEKVSFEGSNDKTRKVKKRREAKKLAKESSKPSLSLLRMKKINGSLCISPII